MSTIADIFKSKSKPKELIERLAEALTTDKKAIREMIEFYGGAKAVERSRCLEALELVTQTDPKLAEPCLELVLQAISDKSPAMKREASRVIANTANTFPEQAVAAIPALLKNSTDEGTVVRWSAALALTEIAKANPQTRKRLLPIITDHADKEENNGVKNIYVKALKILAK
jgi:HEAT repeat protein